MFMQTHNMHGQYIILHTVKHMYTHACVHMSVYMCVCIWRHICVPPARKFAYSLHNPHWSHLSVPLTHTHTHTHARLGARPASVCKCAASFGYCLCLCHVSSRSRCALCVWGKESKRTADKRDADVATRRWRHTLLCSAVAGVKLERLRMNWVGVCVCGE